MQCTGRMISSLLIVSPCAPRCVSSSQLTIMYATWSKIMSKMLVIH